MIRCDAIVVGGGPSGSTCARRLHQAGWNVIVVDRAAFPRDKVCAGWLTPGVFPLLELDPEEYRAAGLTLQEITAFRTSLLDAESGTRERAAVETQYPRVVSYAIRRCEFDDYLLRRAGVCVVAGTPVTTLQRGRDRWFINDAIEAPIVIGAGGHFCPVARHLRGATDASAPVVAKEAEFRLADDVAREVSETPELLFCHDLEGYAWCVRKGDYLNVGIGRRDSRDFSRHAEHFMKMLEADGRLGPDAAVRWRGHAYFAAGVGPRPLIGEAALTVGDAAGLAYPESGEGIHPAIASGRLAADTLIDAGGKYTAKHLQPYADALMRQHPPARRPTTPAMRAASAAIGRRLLTSRLFTRHVLLDRWFLRAQ